MKLTYHKHYWENEGNWYKEGIGGTARTGRGSAVAIKIYKDVILEYRIIKYCSSMNAHLVRPRNVCYGRITRKTESESEFAPISKKEFDRIPWMPLCEKEGADSDTNER